ARMRTWLPAPLLGVATATVAANVFALPIAYVTVPDNLVSSLNVPSAFSVSLMPTLIGPSLILALIASAETLLCATAVDIMHGGPRTDYNKELRAQGVGNMVCGVLGALPMTGVIVRSSANVAAGARTRWSAVLHGAWLLIFVAAFSGALQLIPLAALAGLLVYVGAKLASPAVITKLRRYGTGEVVLFGITVSGVVAIDLLSGVLIGLALSAARLLLRLSRLEMFMEHDPTHKRTVLHLRGAATFLRLADVADQLESVPPDHELHVHFDELDTVDHAVLELFRTWADQHKSRGGHVVLDWEIFEQRYHMQREKGTLGSQSEELKRASNQTGAKHGSAASQGPHPDSRYTEGDRRSTG
ncbi:MAG: SulP family inorganic anion transporter, partial [Deltaproteobacteria bacterium]|nr:SulP family inorganic anion transporter [Deltaproteobacteria bacterium]